MNNKNEANRRVTRCEELSETYGMAALTNMVMNAPGDIYSAVWGNNIQLDKSNTSSERIPLNNSETKFEGLDNYTQHKKDDWALVKRIIIYENPKQFSDFAENSIKKGINKKILMA